jgi:hypothetical protein
VPQTETADFSRITVGSSVEGLGVVAPDLNIKALNTAVKVLPNVAPEIYLANGPAGLNTVLNGGLAASGGFGDVAAHTNIQAPRYTFTFAPGKTVTDFSLHMLDFGDWNPTLSTNHNVVMVAFDADGNPVAQHTVSYTSPSTGMPNTSDLYGDLRVTGDALTSTAGQLGNWTWHVTGKGIVKITLVFGVGFDPNVAFDTLTFTTGCGTSTPVTPTPTPNACQFVAEAADYSKATLGSSLEGLGVVAPDLNIGAAGTAIKVLPGTSPEVYVGNGPSGNVKNGGLAATGGFSDRTAQQKQQAHHYVFTFTPGMQVQDFSLHMLDYGDWNPSLSTSHTVSLVGYDANNNVVAQQVLQYTSAAQAVPPGPSAYGDLAVTGDGITALPYQPGDWTWHIAGQGIVKIKLDFGAGYDPNIAFDALNFSGCR